MSKIPFYIYVLSIILIVAAYWYGVKTDVGAASQAVNSLINTTTGRTGTGQFASYPQGAPA